jgi:hypothetical protein
MRPGHLLLMFSVAFYLAPAKLAPAQTSSNTTNPSVSDCPVTPQVEAFPANGPRGDWYVNADRTIWATFWGWDFVRRGPDVPDPRTGYRPGTKVLWIKPEQSPIIVTGHRLDGDAPPLQYSATDPDTARIIQPSGVYFPTAGCWEVDAKAGPSELHFVVLVKDAAR